MFWNTLVSSVSSDPPCVGKYVLKAKKKKTTQLAFICQNVVMKIPEKYVRFV